MPKSENLIDGEVQNIDDGDGGIISLAYWRGRAQPQFKGFVDHLDSLHDGRFVFRSDDIWIMAYAKSGTHWLNEIATMLLNGNLEPALDKEEYMIENKDAEKLNNLPEDRPRLLNTHLFYSDMPQEMQNAKIIYVSRNPKSVAVSMFRHMKDYPNEPEYYEGEWKTFFNLFLKGVCFNDSWFEYMLEWQAVIDKNPSNILALRYETIKKDPLESIRTIAQFLNCPNTEEFYQAVAEKTEFSNQRSLHFDENSYIKFFYRKGTISDWKNHFTVAQNENFDDFYDKWAANFTGQPFEYE